MWTSMIRISSKQVIFAVDPSWSMLKYHIERHAVTHFFDAKSMYKFNSRGKSPISSPSVRIGKFLISGSGFRDDLPCGIESELPR